MKDLNTPLTDDEIEYLDTFLLAHVDEDADTEGKDEGVLDFSNLDGLFTAIVSGPMMIPPSHWLPVVWGDFEPAWETEQQFMDVFSLMMRHMNDISARLMDQAEEFDPLFLQRDVEGETYAVVDEWCEGYIQGMALAAERWKDGGEEMTALLAPILAFTSYTDWLGHKKQRDDLVQLQQAIAPNVRAIHVYWLERRAEYAPTGQPVRRKGPRVGRNDPCPCGSGKKYKKCCLH